MFFAYRLGAADYSSLSIHGQFAVGVRHLRTEKLGIEVVVIYPADKENYNEDVEAPLYLDQKKAIEV